MTAFAHAGTVSHGTMRPEDLIPAFLDVLRELAPERAADFERTHLVVPVDGLEDEEQAEALDELFTLLDNAAPEGYTFGSHEGDGSDYGFWPSYDAIMESISVRHHDAIMGLLRRVRDELRSEGFYVESQPGTMHSDDYSWALGVWRTALAYLAKDWTNAIDITVKLNEAPTFGDDEAFDGFGMNWSLDIVETGGRILGGLSPYNYTDLVWVDARDEDAVSDRLQLLLDADVSAIPDLCEDR